MSIFDLFDDPTLNELFSSKDNLSNVGNNVVVNKLDFTKKEDLDKLVEAVDYSLCNKSAVFLVCVHKDNDYLLAGVPC